LLLQQGGGESHAVYEETVGDQLLADLATCRLRA